MPLVQFLQVPAVWVWFEFFKAKYFRLRPIGSVPCTWWFSTVCTCVLLSLAQLQQTQLCKLNQSEHNIQGKKRGDMIELPNVAQQIKGELLHSGYTMCEYLTCAWHPPLLQRSLFGQYYLQGCSIQWFWKILGVHVFSTFFTISHRLSNGNRGADFWARGKFSL